MKIKTNIFILYLTLFFAVPAFSQESTEPLDNRVMYTKYYVSDFFNDTSKWAWEWDVVYRRQSQLGETDFWTHPLRYSIRPWIAYQYSKLSRISLNPIGVFLTAPRYPLESDLNRSFERELRTTLQFIHYSYLDRLNFTHRLRFEARWRGIDNESARHYYRFRYRMRIRTPLNTDYFYKNNTWYISKYSEVHVEWGPDYGTNFFSQSRNYIGLGYRFWDWTRLELGYLHQYNTRGNNAQMDVTRGPMFYLFLDILSRNNKRYNYSF
ncbi:MAG: DUF2490 domain-containing protein [Crocinitomicaceae bacterium]|nr:DUF2490 domain-containing protein [Crocinitomicaceae bacterium]